MWELYNNMKIAWVCDLCNWLQVSDSDLRHQMDYCKCKQTAIDLENEYTGAMGNPRIIARFTYKWVRARK